MNAAAKGIPSEMHPTRTAHEKKEFHTEMTLGRMGVIANDICREWHFVRTAFGPNVTWWEIVFMREAFKEKIPCWEWLLHRTAFAGKCIWRETHLQRIAFRANVQWCDWPMMGNASASNYTSRDRRFARRVNRCRGFRSLGTVPIYIPNCTFENCASVLTPCITKFFHLCLSTSTFPSCWKYTYIQPGQKKG